MKVHHKPEITGKLATGCVFAFLAPFALVGVGAFVFAIVSLVKGDLAAAGFAAVFALGFGGAAFGVGTAVLASGRNEAAVAKLRAEHQEEPWLLNREWATGQIKSGGKGLVAVLWFIAVLWNSISAPGLWVVLSSPDEGPEKFLFLLFPIVGLFLIAAAVYRTAAYRRYGVSIFEMAHVPGVIGRGVGGMIYARLPRGDVGEVQLRLSCLNRIVTGSGKNRSTTEKMIWQHDQVVTEFRWDVGRNEATVPVVFRIPADAQASNGDNPSNAIVWRLTAKADVPGVDYGASFEIPVFRTRESEEPLPESQPEEIRSSERPWATGKITVRDTVRGLEVNFPAARHPGAALAVTLFGLVWTGAVVFMLLASAPFLFPIVFGLFDLLVISFVLKLWLNHSTVLADKMVLTVTGGLAFATKTKRIEKDEIETIEVKRGMQAGSKLYYDIQLKRTDGKIVVLGTAVPNETDAKRIVFAVKDALNLETQE